MLKLANDLGVGRFGLSCAQQAWRMWQGGNQWSGWTAYLSFFRKIAKLDIDWSKWIHWENAAMHAGPRIMHKEFCIVSDRPEILLVDDQNRPHAVGGPFCQWRDGSALYAYEGVRMPAKYGSVHPKDWKSEWVLQEENADIRAKLLQEIGFERFIAETGAEVVAEQELHGLPYTLLEKEDPTVGRMLFLKMKNPSVPDLWHVEEVENFLWITTPFHALQWRWGANTSEECNYKPAWMA